MGSREGVGAPRRAPRRGRARPALHRPAPRARGHLAPGVRRPAARRPHRPPPRPHRRDDGPQRPDRRAATGRSPTRSPPSRSRCSRANCAEFGIRLYAMGDPGQGIVHVIGPEQGLTQPGMTIVCGDSHTSTHGAFGALAFGIGTSEVEHVLATQTLPQAQPRTMAITVDGDARRRASPPRTSSSRSSPASAPAAGSARSSSTAARRSASLSMEGRMTVCNMSIEAGARAGHDRARRHDVRLPRGPAVRARAAKHWERALDDWRSLPDRRRRRRSTRRSCSTRPTLRPSRHAGARTPARRRRSTTSCPTPTRSPTRPSASRHARAAATWA